MTKKENWIESFRTQSRENVYVLTLRVVVKGTTIVDVREVVDGLKGEVGVRYANNLLCRLANERLKDTDLEKVFWREHRGLGPKPDLDFSYVKIKNEENYAKAGMKWYQQLPEKFD